VDVAIRRLGTRCTWRTASGRWRSREASSSACAAQPLWIRARGTRRWSLRLASALPAGRYVVLSRATIAAGFSEARFGTRDGNQASLRVP
jgi:hypothetical protein